MVIAALDGVFSIQLDVHIAAAGGLNGSTASIDIHAAQGDIGGDVVRHLDGDGVGGGGFAVVLSDHRGRIRYILLISLANSLPALAGVHGDVAVLQIPGLRQYGNRQADCQKQRHHTG